jgi:hypothetical protein
MYNKNLKKQKEEQIGIPLNVKQDNSIAFLKHTFDKQVISVTVTPYWRSFPFVLAFVYSWITFIFLGIILYFNYPNLPSQIPLLYSQSLVGWELIDKRALLIMMCFLFMFNVLNPFINSKIYNFDKRLILILSFAIIIIDSFLLIALNELFFLVISIK